MNPDVSTANTEADILNRLIPEDARLAPEAARFFLTIEFAKADLERMHELAQKNQEGTLTPQEEQELDRYLNVGYFLDLLRSRARISLSDTSPAC